MVRFRHLIKMDGRLGRCYPDNSVRGYLMKLKLLPAISAALLAGGLSAAQADVSIFGHIDTSIDSVDQDGGSDDVNMHCTTCSIGFKGSEDLGNGLKAIFSLDFQYDTANRVSDGSITDRDQWLGLAGGFGSVKAGTISTIYKSHGAMIDPLYRTALQGRERGLQSDFHNGAGENLEGRADNTIRYDSPDWNGLKAGAFYTLDSDETDGDDNNPYGVGIDYTNGGFLAYADYQDNAGSSSDFDGDIHVWKVGGKYARGMFAVYGQYEDGSIDDQFVAPAVDYDLTVWQLGASATLGNTMAYFAYGQGDFDFSGGPDDNYTSWTLALTHNLSKRTMLYTGFSEIDCDVRVEGTTACGQVGDSGGEDDKYSVGMKHRF